MAKRKRKKLLDSDYTFIENNLHLTDDEISDELHLSKMEVEMYRAQYLRSMTKEKPKVVPRKKRKYTKKTVKRSDAPVAQKKEEKSLDEIALERKHSDILAPYRESIFITNVKIRRR